ncbi:hypothetical protein AAUPMB_05513 [Pasteurella multocida subsp. multocida str. Anand1_buffalo]|nr:hypothetical protein AAUPMB_05513 [Pasteurella multocida subsp. multocida str. Anand1_buffalo]
MAEAMHPLTLLSVGLYGKNVSPSEWSPDSFSRPLEIWL